MDSLTFCRPRVSKNKNANFRNGLKLKIPSQLGFGMLQSAELTFPLFNNSIYSHYVVFKVIRG